MSFIAPVAVMVPPPKPAPTAQLVPFSGNPKQPTFARPATRNSTRARAKLPLKTAPTLRLKPTHHKHNLRTKGKSAFTRSTTPETTRARAELPHDSKPVHKSLPKGVYQVDKILGSKEVGRNKYYLIKWKGYNTKDNSWEPEVNVSTDLVAAFEINQGT
ncbi:hypothetical protein V496_01250 [Pseudogymnoascus sp. VKM F-4515 (FW-2607)]|nr:hypothetical protein V496_01250 [Pseudogymnoascus sp. VKM F-4515 (FW-2607)]